MYRITYWKAFICIVILLGVAACASKDTSTPTEAIAAPCPTCPPPKPESTIPPSPAPEPTSTPEPRTLTICLGAEPDTLFFYQSSMLVANSVMEAIYDGPIDRLSYSYKPVALKKLPNLADGDARIEAITVQTGDRVVDDNGEVVRIKDGVRVRPYGCNQRQCAVTFDGRPLEMAQLSAGFTLLEDLHWSDGESLTAADAVFSFKIALQCESNLEWCVNHSLVERTADFVALDERTTRWIGLPGFMDPKYMTNFFHPLPEHQLRDMPVIEMAEADETARHPIGWGPYKIDKWEFGKEIRMSKNPFYFRSEEGLPRFDQLVVRFTGEYSPLNISKILAGECDLVDQDAQLEDALDLLLGMDQQGLLQAHTVNGPAWEHFDFSLLHGDYDDGYQVGSDRPDIFGDVRTRQAIAMCLDRERVINEAVYQLPEFEQPYLDPSHPLYDEVFGIGDAPNTYIPSDHPLYNPEVLVYRFNPQEANLLLEEAGWIDQDGNPGTPRQAQSVPNVPNGTLLEFGYWTTSSNERKQVAQILADSMANCGIRVNIQHWEPTEFFELPESPVFSRDFDVVEFAWLTSETPPCECFLSENIPGDPELLNPDGTQRFPQGWEGQNNSGYRSAEYDQACRAALAALPGQLGYIENHLLAQEIFARDLPVVPLFQRIKVTAARADMCGYEMDATANSDTWNIEQYGYGDECEK